MAKESNDNQQEREGGEGKVEEWVGGQTVAGVVSHHLSTPHTCPVTQFGQPPTNPLITPTPFTDVNTKPR